MKSKLIVFVVVVAAFIACQPEVKAPVEKQVAKMYDRPLVNVEAVRDTDRLEYLEKNDLRKGGRAIFMSRVIASDMASRRYDSTGAFISVAELRKIWDTIPPLKQERYIKGYLARFGDYDRISSEISINSKGDTMVHISDDNGFRYYPFSYVSDLIK